MPLVECLYVNSTQHCCILLSVTALMHPEHEVLAANQIPFSLERLSKTHPSCRCCSDAARRDAAEEEVPAGQVPVCAAHCWRRRPLPLQTQQELGRRRRPRVWLRRDPAGELAPPHVLTLIHFQDFCDAHGSSLWIFFFFFFVADFSHAGRPDRSVPGPHEGSLPNERQLHDAEHQPVVHPGAGPR